MIQININVAKERKLHHHEAKQYIIEGPAWWRKGTERMCFDGAVAKVKDTHVKNGSVGEAEVGGLS